MENKPAVVVDTTRQEKFLREKYLMVDFHNLTLNGKSWLEIMEEYKNHVPNYIIESWKKEEEIWQERIKELEAEEFADKVEINHFELENKDLKETNTFLRKENNQLILDKSKLVDYSEENKELKKGLLLKDIPYQRLLGEFEGLLNGMLYYDLPEVVKEELRKKIKELEGK
jgi:hypothetical protein